MNEVQGLDCMINNRAISKQQSKITQLYEHDESNRWFDQVQIIKYIFGLLTNRNQQSHEWIETILQHTNIKKSNFIVLLPMKQTGTLLSFSYNFFNNSHFSQILPSYMHAERYRAVSYSRNDEKDQFSNFYPSLFTVNEITYATNQHYFQSQKFKGHPHQFTVVNAHTPQDALQLGISRQFPLREDWEQVKEEVMYEGLRHKFAQNSHLKKKLQETGIRAIVEYRQKEGDEGDGLDKFRFGMLLMKLRQQLRK